MNTEVMFSSKTNEWATPQAFFNQLNEEFDFNLDPCATDENNKCDNYFTEKDDGLKQSWDGYRVFCNPPYGKVLGKWVEKASKTMGGGSGDVNTSQNRYKILSRIHLQ